MSGDFFTELEAELGSLTRAGTHLEGAAAHRRRRISMMIKRAAVTIGLAVALAASLSSEFPDTAGGHVSTAHAWVAQSW